MATAGHDPVAPTHGEPADATSKNPAVDDDATPAYFQKLQAWLSRPLEVLGRFGGWLLVGLAVYHTGLFLWIAFVRASYPFDVEWMEGAMVDHVRIIAEHGHPYIEPSLDFAPFIYNPLYYYVGYVVSWFTGIDYFALRFVSIVGWLGTMALSMELVRRESRSWFAGVATAGLLAATYAITDGWHDLARVDSLLLALMMLSLVLARFARGRRGWLLAGFALFLAFGVKQVALGLVPPLCLYLLWARGFRAATEFALACLLPSLALVAVMQWASDGWYWYYAFEIPATHTSKHDLLRWKHQFLGELSLTFPLAFVYFVAPAQDAEARRAKVFHALVAFTLVGIAVLARAHTGSWHNDNVTAYIAVIVLCGIGAGRLLPSANASTQPARLTSIFTIGVLAAQFALLDYGPRRWMPQQKDFEEARWLVDQIQAYEGEVYLPHHGHIGWRSGKTSHAHDMALYDIRRAKVDFRGAQKKLERETRDALRKHRFAAIITDRDSRAYVRPKLLKSYYRIDNAEFFEHEKALIMRSGIHIRPNAIWEPKERRGQKKDTN